MRERAGAVLILIMPTLRALLILNLLLLLTGCTDSPSAPRPQSPAVPAATHAHIGPHGGALLALGNDHVELTYDDAQTRLVLYSFGADAATATPLAPGMLTGLVKTNESGEFQELAFAPVDGTSAASHFASAPVPLKSEFEVVLRLKSGETVYRALALLDPGDIAANKFVCPMHAGKTFSAPGTCPVCGMKLVELKGGALEHADHRPRHGGVFFMSADNWHHLEGVFAPPDEFRLYVYNNFTRPISVASFDAVAEFAPKVPGAKPVAQQLQPAASNAYLTLRVPPDSALPPTVAVRIKFKPDQPAELFNFSFSDSAPPLR